MKAGEVLFLNEKEIKQLISPELVLKLVETALAGYAKGDSVNPPKLHLPFYPTYEGYLNSMPSFTKSRNLAGVKLVSVHKRNPSLHHLPATMGTIVLHQPETGMPYAILGGTHITEMRTGAVAGVAAKYLAKKSSKVLTIVGAGAQGLTSMEMITLAMQGIKEIRVVDIRPENQEHFITKAKEMFPDINYVAYLDRQEAFQGSDIIVMATTATKSLLEGIELDKGTTVVIIDEKITPKVVGMFDKWIVDFKECVLERENATNKVDAEINGEEFESLDEAMVTGEIGDVIIDKIAGRVNDEEKVLADAVGMSITDVSVARAAYDAALEKNLGVVLPFQDI